MKFISTHKGVITITLIGCFFLIGYASIQAEFQKIMEYSGEVIATEPVGTILQCSNIYFNNGTVVRVQGEPQLEIGSQYIITVKGSPEVSAIIISMHKENGR